MVIVWLDKPTLNFNMTPVFPRLDPIQLHFGDAKLFGNNFHPGFPFSQFTFNKFHPVNG
jgi:hypothetical protein